MRRSLCLAIPLLAWAALACPQVRRFAANDKGPLLAAQKGEILVAHRLAKAAFEIERLELVSASDAYGRLTELRLEDPVEQVKARMIEVLEREAGLRNLRAEAEPLADAGLDAVKARQRTGLAIDLATAQWALEGTHLKYYARARIVDVDRSRVIWSGSCHRLYSDDGHEGPSLESLVANDGALLKEKLVEVARRCGDELARLAVDVGETRGVVAAADSPGAVDPRLPKVGDRWEYRYVEGLRSRRAAVEVVAVAPSAIDERVTVGKSPAAQWSYGKNSGFAFNSLWLEFAPYLLSYRDSPTGMRWHGLDTRRIPICTFATVSCSVEGRYSGRASVTTPAGTLETVVLEFEVSIRDINRGRNGVGGRQQITYWYSPAAKRMAKMSSRRLRGFSPEGDYTVELTSFQVH